jgi:hypothetical protein
LGQWDGWSGGTECEEEGAEVGICFILELTRQLALLPLERVEGVEQGWMLPLPVPPSVCSYFVT